MNKNVLFITVIIVYGYIMLFCLEAAYLAYALGVPFILCLFYPLFGIFIVSVISFWYFFKKYLTDNEK